MKTNFVVANCGFEFKKDAEYFKYYYGFPDHVCSPPYAIWDYLDEEGNVVLKTSLL